MQPISKRQINSADHEKWELNRMYIGGAIKNNADGLKEEVVDNDDMEDQRVILMVHDIKPPFLDGRIVFTK